MSSASDRAFHEPRIAALLRLAQEVVHASLYEQTAAAGHGELRPAHFRLLRFPGIDGARPTVVADRLGTTKQAINPLLNDLEAWGYLERRPDPEDGRGRLLTLTDRGHALMDTVRRLHAGIEREWEERLGPERFGELRAALLEIAQSHPAVARPPRPD